jgi:valyl-tRNA synthetase
VDPLELIDKYGADALRFTLTAMTTAGTDFPLDYDPAVGQSPRMKGYRAFCNKLWNASRFLLMNLEGGEIAPQPVVEPGDWAERWILARHERAVRAAGEALEEHRFHELAHVLYHFVWGELCDWYIELAKPYLSADDERGARARGVALHVVDSTLRLLHPVIPFITEELWQKLPAQGDGRPASIMDTAYPQSDPARRDEDAERRVGLWTELITKARNTRIGVGIEPGRRVPLQLASDDAGVRAMLEDGLDAIGLLAKCDPVTVHEKLPGEGPSARGVVTSAELRIPLEGIVDAEKERQRHRREMAKLDGELEKVNRKLTSESFLTKAPPEVVEKTRRILEELQEKKQRLEETLASLEG